MIIHVDDADDPRLVDYFKMTDVELRRHMEPARGLYMAESTNVIARAIEAGHRPRSVLTAERWLADLAPVLARARGAEGTPDGGDIPVFVAPEPLLETITGYRLHRSALAAMHRPELPSVTDVLSALDAQGPGPRRIVILEDIVDHTNVGAIFRSVAGLGADAVIITPSCADPLYRRSVRVSMGTILQVPWARMQSWPAGVADLQRAGYTVAAMGLNDTAISLDDFVRDLPERLAIIMGTEGPGLGSSTVAAADAVVTIPMAAGVDSLNVGAAAAVVCWATRPN